MGFPEISAGRSPPGTPFGQAWGTSAAGRRTDTPSQLPTSSRPSMIKDKRLRWKVIQAMGPLLPIPLGCYFLYKAIKSFNRSPPPYHTDMQRPLYPEPVYKGISFAPSTFASNMMSREGRFR